MSYVTTDDLEAKLETTLTEAQSSYFSEVLLPAIQQYIEEATGTYFENGTEAEVYVDGTDTKSLIIPTMSEIVSLHAVSEGGTETLIPADSYYAYPRTGAILALRNKSGTWDEGYDNYKVTGKLGYAGVPANIKAIALELASNDLNANLNNYKSERVGDWSVTYGDTSDSTLSTASLNTLNSYRRLSRSV